MTEFLTPLNQLRTYDFLKQLDTCETITELNTAIKQHYPSISSKMDYKIFDEQGLLLELVGFSHSQPTVFTSFIEKSTHVHTKDDTVISDDTCVSDNTVITTPSNAYLTSLLESLDSLLEEGYHPSGGIIICISFNTSTINYGAIKTVHYLKMRNIQPCFILSPGGYLSTEAFRTFIPKNSPIAFVGISEKYMLEGTVKQLSDNSKLNIQSKIRDLIKISHNFIKRNKNISLCFATKQMLKAFSKHAPLWHKHLALHSRLFFPILYLKWHKRLVFKHFFTCEKTIKELSISENSIANNDSVLKITQSFFPDTSIEKATKKFENKIKSEKYELEITQIVPPCKTSSITSEAYTALQTAIEIQFDNVIIAPCVSPCLTPANYYHELSSNNYRFSPFVFSSKDILTNTCTITEDSLQNAVQFFRTILSV